MSKLIAQYIHRSGIWSFAWMSACSDDNNPAGVNSSRVSDPFPLALGNAWNYSLVQDAFINRDTTILDSTIDLCPACKFLGQPASLNLTHRGNYGR